MTDFYDFTSIFSIVFQRRVQFLRQVQFPVRQSHQGNESRGGGGGGGASI